jgi:hypothetical protein
MQRTGRLTPIAEKLSEEERAIITGNAFLECDEIAGPEYEAKRRAFLLACKGLAQKELPAAIREGLKRARARGVRIGRPQKVADELLLRVFRETRRNIAATARAVGLSYAATYERLHRKGMVSDKASGPRLAGGCG